MKEFQLKTAFGFLFPVVIVRVETEASPGPMYHLTVLHTNDFHAKVKGIYANGEPCSLAVSSAAKVCFGGSARLSTMIKRKRAKFSNTIVLSAGDEFPGFERSTYTFEGQSLASFMNLIGYDAMTLGNHEFDHGISGLFPFLQNVRFPVLSANADLKRTPKLQGLVSKSTVLDIGGQKIGVVGYTTTGTVLFSHPETVTFRDELESIQMEVDRLTSLGINKIIALGHAGFHEDKAMARKLKNVDLIVGGHSHTFLYNGTPPTGDTAVATYPFTVKSIHQGQDVHIVQNAPFGKYLGELHLTFDDHGIVTNFFGNPVLLDNSVEKDMVLLKAIDADDVKEQSSSLNTVDDIELPKGSYYWFILLILISFCLVFRMHRVRKKASARKQQLT